MACPDVVAIVPAYNPDEALPRLVGALRGRLALLVVDDGSEDASVFERLPGGAGGPRDGLTGAGEVGENGRQGADPR